MNIILTAILAFVISAALGPVVIPFLRKLKFGQSIKEIGPSWHKSKQGTPTMGGIMFIAASAAAFLIFSVSDIGNGDIKPVGTLVACLLYGLIGFADDFIKVVKKRNLGLTGFQKLVLQILVAAGYLMFLTTTGGFSTAISIPGLISFDLSYWFYPLAIIFIAFVVNAVNLTDGVDGLAGSVILPVLILYFAMSVSCGSDSFAKLIIAIGTGILGFLIFNFHPAKVFMGDTGSLFLGGVVALIPFAFNMPVIILLSNLVFIFEAVSVMIQVFVFKLTKKRVFKMTPIHHHFEMCGWSEKKIVAVFTGISALFCLASYFLFIF